MNPVDSMDESDIVAIGKIVGCHGVRGVLKLLPYTESSDYFYEASRLLLRCEGGRESGHTVSWSKPHKRIILLALDDITSLEAGDRLRGCEVVVARSWLQEPESGSWYWIDLIGMAVVDHQKKPLGVLEAIIETGSNDVYVVKQGNKEILVPALASVVLSVDVEGKTMTVDLPEGLDG